MSRFALCWSFRGVPVYFDGARRLGWGGGGGRARGGKTVLLLIKFIKSFARPIFEREEATGQDDGSFFNRRTPGPAIKLSHRRKENRLDRPLLLLLYAAPPPPPTLSNLIRRHSAGRLCLYCGSKFAVDGVPSVSINNSLASLCNVGLRWYPINIKHSLNEATRIDPRSPRRAAEKNGSLSLSFRRFCRERPPRLYFPPSFLSFYFPRLFLLGVLSIVALRVVRLELYRGYL